MVVANKCKKDNICSPEKLDGDGVEPGDYDNMKPSFAFPTNLCVKVTPKQQRKINNMFK